MYFKQYFSTSTIEPFCYFPQMALFHLYNYQEAGSQKKNGKI